MAQTSSADNIFMSEKCEIVSKKTCYDIETTPSGQIILAGNRSLDICDRNGKVQRTVFSPEGDFTSIQYFKGHIYTLLKEPKGSNRRKVIVFETPSYKESCRWNLPDYGFVSMLAVSNDKVYVVDSDAKRVKVYSLVGKLITDFQHTNFKNPVYMSDYLDNGVLLSDWSAGVVYKIDSIEDRVEWNFKVATPRGIHCDKRGNIWVWSSRDKVLVLRSVDGE